MSIIKKKDDKKWRYVAGYHDRFGRYKRKSSKWFDSKKECKEQEALFLASKTHSASNLSFKALFIQWHEFSSRNNTFRTVTDKRTSIETYCPDLMDVKVEKITPGMIQFEFDQPEFKRLSTNRKNKVHGYLKSMFRYAIDFHGLDVNPMDPIPRFKKTHEENMREMKVYTPDEFKRFEMEIDDETSRALIHTLYYTGMRLNECRSLRFKDIKGNKIDLKEQYDDKTKTWVALKTKGSVRTITLDRSTMMVIANQRDRYASLPYFTNEWFIFGGLEKVPHTTLTRHKNDAIDRAGLHRIRLHDLRHSHVSFLINQGVDYYQISKRLGHSSISITLDRYGHLLDRDESDIIGALNTLENRATIYATKSEKTMPKENKRH